jgi:hypothetical protein
MKRSSDIESDSEDTSSSSSDGPNPQGRLLWHGS